MIEKHAWLFRDHPESHSTGCVDDLIEVIDDGLDHTWAIGPDVIYAALALRTFAERRDLASAWVVDGLRDVLRRCRAQPLEIIGGVFDVRGVDAAEVDEAEVQTWPAVAGTALRTILEVDHIYLGLHQGDVGYLADHAQALWTLHRLGYEDVADAGLRGYREHVAALRRVGRSTTDVKEVHVGLQADPRKVPYWDAVGGSNDWAVGHAFKYPYAFFDLLTLRSDPTLEAPLLRRLGQLIVDEP